MSTRRYIAVDLGASGGRVLVGSILDDQVQLDEIHRFANGPVKQGKRLVWDLLRLWQDILIGLREAAKQFGDEIHSVGVDTWGVDYVLLDGNDDQLGHCFSHRDSRTFGILDKAFGKLSRAEIFQETGLQFMEINSAYQLLAMRLEESPQLDIAEQFLMVPDYFHWQLSGIKCNEFTNASTTQLLRPVSGGWSEKVLEAFDIPRRLFSEPRQPGESLGKIETDVQVSTGLPEDTEVILPATHDTGSAVIAVPADSFAPAQPDWCYISCGTWSLMGVELDKPNLSDLCQRFNFTNEGGVEGSVRLLKNIGGLWVAQQCRQQFARQGLDLQWSELAKLAEEAPIGGPVVDTDAPGLVAPSNMVDAVQEFCRNTGQSVPQTPGEVIRCALEGLALRYRITLEKLEELLGNRINTVHLVGGGTQNALLCQLTADICGRDVVVGPVEATALGNVLMQAIGSGQLSSVVEARRLIRGTEGIRVVKPQASYDWEPAVAKLREVSES